MQVLTSDVLMGCVLLVCHASALNMDAFQWYALVLGWAGKIDKVKANVAFFKLFIRPFLFAAVFMVSRVRPRPAARLFQRWHYLRNNIMNSVSSQTALYRLPVAVTYYVVQAALLARCVDLFWNGGNALWLRAQKLKSQ